jgi:hypothetical protein
VLHPEELHPTIPIPPSDGIGDYARGHAFTSEGMRTGPLVVGNHYGIGPLARTKRSPKVPSPCSETMLTGASQFHISTPQGI